MDDRERLLAVLAVKAGFVDASTVRLGSAMGAGLLQHLERAGALTAKRRDLLALFAAETAAAHGGAAGALRALLDPTDPLAAQSGGLGDEDDEPTRALEGRAPVAIDDDDVPTLPLGTKPPPLGASGFADEDDEQTRALGTRPVPAPKAGGLGDEDDEPTRALPTRR